MNLPVGTINGLYALAFKKSKAEANKGPTVEDLEEVLEEGG